MLNSKFYKKQLVFMVMFVLAVGVATSLLRNYSAGEIEDHIVYKATPEQTAQVEKRLNENTFMKLLSGELVDEQFKQLEDLTISNPKD